MLIAPKAIFTFVVVNFLLSNGVWNFENSMLECLLIRNDWHIVLQIKVVTLMKSVRLNLAKILKRLISKEVIVSGSTECGVSQLFRSVVGEHLSIHFRGNFRSLLISQTCPCVSSFEEHSSAINGLLKAVSGFIEFFFPLHFVKSTCKMRWANFINVVL